MSIATKSVAAKSVGAKSIAKQIQQAVKFIGAQTTLAPEVLIVLGTGMGDFARQVQGTTIPYEDIPGFANSTVPTHAGRLIIGRLMDRPVAVMQGRLHRYEGYSAEQVVFPLRVMAALGARTVLMTNAAGGLQKASTVGDLVLIEDHFSLANLAGEDPLRFGYEESLGPRFVTMNGAYDGKLMSVAEEVADSLGEKLKRGVYAYVSGPSFETPAEVRMLQRCDCDLVGMSTIPEVIAARQADMRVLVISAVTNLAVSSVDDNYVTNADDIFSALEEISPRVQDLLTALIPEL